MKNAERINYAASIQAMDDDELGNEIYTLRNERQFLNCWSDDEVKDRLNMAELEMECRSRAGFAS